MRTLLLAAVLLLPVIAQAEEVNLNTWTEDFIKVATGAKDDVQYNV